MTEMHVTEKHVTEIHVTEKHVTEKHVTEKLGFKVTNTVRERLSAGILREGRPGSEPAS